LYAAVSVVRITPNAFDALPHPSSLAFLSPFEVLTKFGFSP
jgi:hypothetical protein